MGNGADARVEMGKSNKDIAAELQITEATVKGHMTKILGKPGVTDRSQAVITAVHPPQAS